MKCCGNKLRRAGPICNGICANGHTFWTNGQIFSLIGALLLAFWLAVGTTVWWVAA